MRMLFQHKTLKSHLIAFAILALIPLIVLNALSLQYQARVRLESAMQNREDLASAVGDAVLAFVQDAINTTHAAAAALDDHIPPKEARGYLKEIREANPDFEQLIYLNSTGRVLASYPDRTAHSTYNDETWFRKILGSKQHSYISDVYNGGPDDSIYFYVASKVTSIDGRKSILAAVISPEALRRFTPSGDRKNIAITDSGGHVVSSEIPGLPQGLTVSPERFPGYRSALNGEVARVSDWRDPVDKVLKIGAWVPINDINWVVGDLEPQSDVLRPLYAVQKRNIITLLAFAAFSAFVAWLFGEQMSRPIRRLSRDAAKISAGDLTVRTSVKRDDEIGQLAISFNEMASNLEALSQVSSAATSLLDIHSVLESIAAEVRKATGFDFCGVGLLDEQQQEIRFTVSSGARSSFLQNNPVPVGASISGKAVVDKKAVIATKDQDIDVFFNTFVQAEGIEAAISTPIVSHDEVLGVLNVFSRTPRNIQKRDVQLLEAMANLAAVGIRNAMIYRRERRIAETLQLSFLPDVPPQLDGFEIADFYQAAWQEAKVGGDFYDFFTLGPGQYGIVIGDVSGKGLKAAVVTAMAKYMLRAFASETSGPAEILGRLNNALVDSLEPDTFISVFIGVLDTNEGLLRFSSAGHELPLLYEEAKAKGRFLSVTGVLAGVVKNASFDVMSVRFQPDDCLLLYTDGVTEARSDSGLLGQDGLLEIVQAESSQKSAREIVDKVFQKIQSFSNNEIRDDIAMVVVKRIVP